MRVLSRAGVRLWFYGSLLFQHLQLARFWLVVLCLFRFVWTQHKFKISVHLKACPGTVGFVFYTCVPPVMLVTLLLLNACAILSC